MTQCPSSLSLSIHILHILTTTLHHNRFIGEEEMSPLLQHIGAFIDRLQTIEDTRNLNEYFVRPEYITYRRGVLARLQQVLRDVLLLQRQWVIVR